MPGSSIPIKVNGEEMLVIKEEDIIAILGNDND
jgi:co-chaperonin GroES (HSP10)